LNSFAGLRIDRHQSVRLVQIATGAHPRQIVEFAPATERSRDKVIDVKSCSLQALVHAAEFASAARPINDKPSDGGRNRHGWR
jgi:hypothetical protein